MQIVDLHDVIEIEKVGSNVDEIQTRGWRLEKDAAGCAKQHDGSRDDEEGDEDSSSSSCSDLEYL